MGDLSDGDRDLPLACQNGLDSELGDRLGEKLGDRLGDRSDGNCDLTPTRQNILELIEKDAKISFRKLAAALGFSQTAIEKNIGFLKAKGYLRRQGSARGGCWEVLK